MWMFPKILKASQKVPLRICIYEYCKALLAGNKRQRQDIRRNHTKWLKSIIRHTVQPIRQLSRIQMPIQTFSIGTLLPTVTDTEVAAQWCPAADASLGVSGSQYTLVETKIVCSHWQYGAIGPFQKNILHFNNLFWKNREYLLVWKDVGKVRVNKGVIKPRNVSHFSENTLEKVTSQGSQLLSTQRWQGGCLVMCHRRSPDSC